MQHTITIHATWGDFKRSATMSRAILPIFKYGAPHCTNTLQSFKVPADRIFYAPTERELLICMGHIVPGNFIDHVEEGLMSLLNKIPI